MSDLSLDIELIKQQGQEQLELTQQTSKQIDELRDNFDALISLLADINVLEIEEVEISERVN